MLATLACLGAAPEERRRKLEERKQDEWDYWLAPLAGISLFVACRHYHAGGVMHSAHRRVLSNLPAVLGDK